MAFDDTGDWETGTGCTATKGTGPCQDQSLWETPGMYCRFDPLIESLSIFSFLAIGRIVLHASAGTEGAYP